MNAQFWRLQGRAKTAVVVVASVALGVAGVILAILLRSTPPPVAVEGLTGVVDSEALTVEFTWQNPEPREGDAFSWADTTPGRDATPRKTDAASVTLPIGIEGEVCVAVQTVRGDQTSPPADRCVEVDFYVADGEIKEPVVLTVAGWDLKGLQASAFDPRLDEEYEESHPWVDIQLEPQDMMIAYDELMQAIDEGSGAPSVVLIDVGISEFVGQSDGFVDLLGLGAEKYRGRFPAWVWDQAATADGSTVIGLGYDASGLALCYRSDLFQQAGLPYEREEVSAEVGDNWGDFIAFGERYVEATGKPFIDNATSMFWPAVIQQGTGYTFYDRENNLNTANVKPAFDIALEAIRVGLSTGFLEFSFSTEWYAALSNGDFAVTLCPSWELPIIRANVGQGSTAEWDIADIPGPGGNWGGKYLAIPDQGTEQEQEEAWAFIEWLLEPEQALKVAQEAGNPPAQSDLLDSSVVHNLVDPFFNRAAFGDILAKTILDIPAGVYLAPNTGIFRSSVEGILDQVQAGNISAEDAWGRAVEDVEYHDGEEGPGGA